MAKAEIRFGIRDGRDRSGATWKLWCHDAAGRSEVYIASRPLGGVLKASLHHSGRWHIAYSQQAYEEFVQGVNPRQKDRFIDKWPRPSEFAPGCTFAFRIVTPFSAITTPVDPKKTKAVTWIPNAPEGKATEIDVVITKPHVPVFGWPGKHYMGTSLVDAMQLPSGEAIWVVHWVIDLPNFTEWGTGSGRFFKGRARGDIVGKRLRGIAFGTGPDGSRVIYDVAGEGPEA